MTHPPKVPRPEPAPRVPNPAVDQVVGLPWPVIRPHGDGTATVTFARHDPSATSVLLFVNRLTDERNLAASEMEPAGDGLWLLSYRMEQDWRASYAFLTHRGDGPAPWRQTENQPGLRALLDTAEADPGNPLRTVNKAGHAVSVVELPAAPPQRFRAGPGAPRPPATLLGTATGAPREVWAHRAGAGDDLPLVVLPDGETWLDRYSLTVSLDAAVAAGALPPVQAVFVGTGDRAARWNDVGHAGGVTAFAAEVVVPWARRQPGVTDDPCRTVLAGQSLGGLSALWALAAHGEVFGAAVAQSASLWQSVPPVRAGRLYLEVGRQEWVLLPLHRSFAADLRDSGAAVELTYVEYNGGHDYACWRGGLLDGLAAVLS